MKPAANGQAAATRVFSAYTMPIAPDELGSAFRAIRMAVANATPKKIAGIAKWAAETRNRICVILCHDNP